MEQEPACRKTTGLATSVMERRRVRTQPLGTRSCACPNIGNYGFDRLADLAPVQRTMHSMCRCPRHNPQLPIEVSADMGHDRLGDESVRL